jgi:hypothetical protein
MRLKLVYLFYLSVLTLFSVAQSKKEIKNNKIKSVTELETVTENGKEITYKIYYCMFDKSGRIIEETDFNKNGNIQKRILTRYDNNNNKIEETYFYDKGSKPVDDKIKAESKQNLNTRTAYKYNANNDKTEETMFEIPSGKLITKQNISYNGKGEKVMEDTFNGEGKLIKKTTYTYDNKGLKVEKKIFNDANTLQTKKKYVYELY